MEMVHSFCSICGYYKTGHRPKFALLGPAFAAKDIAFEMGKHLAEKHQYYPQDIALQGLNTNTKRYIQPNPENK